MADSYASRLLGAKPPVAARPVSLAVKQYMDRHVPGGVVIAVSGGADSTALAIATIDIASRRAVPVRTVTIDHGIRPESVDEAASVREMMARMGAEEAFVERTGTASASLGPEGQAREARFGRLLEQTRDFQRAWNLKTVDLLLGHTMDDQAETVLLRLGRGAGARSLSGMSSRYPMNTNGSAHRGRPLLGVRRKDTVAFCEAVGVPYVSDPTNQIDSTWRTAGGEPLRRAAVRHWAMPKLEQSLGVDPVPSLARTARQLREDNEALDHYAHRIWDELAARGGTDVTVPVSAVEGVPAAIRRRLWRICAQNVGTISGELSDRQLRAVDTLVAGWKGQGPVQLPGHVAVWREGASIVFTGKAAPLAALKE